MVGRSSALWLVGGSRRSEVEVLNHLREIQYAGGRVKRVKRLFYLHLRGSGLRF